MRQPGDDDAQVDEEPYDPADMVPIAQLLDEWRAQKERADAAGRNRLAKLLDDGS